MILFNILSLDKLWNVRKKNVKKRIIAILKRQVGKVTNKFQFASCQISIHSAYLNMKS